MEQLSIFDIFKIGVGPSSSHTLGPWKAASAFRNTLTSYSFDNISITLYGSLSKTGKGHKTELRFNWASQDSCQKPPIPAKWNVFWIKLK